MARPQMVERNPCAACGSVNTVIVRGRVLHCKDCEITYYIPAPELARRMRKQ